MTKELRVPRPLKRCEYEILFATRQAAKGWQYKITSGGRLWYFVDETVIGKYAGQVYIERAEPGHPKETDQTRRKKR